MHGTASGSAEIQGPVSFGFGSMLPARGHDVWLLS